MSEVRDERKIGGNIRDKKRDFTVGMGKTDNGNPKRTVIANIRGKKGVFNGNKLKSQRLRPPGKNRHQDQKGKSA